MKRKDFLMMLMMMIVLVTIDQGEKVRGYVQYNFSNQVFRAVVYEEPPFVMLNEKTGKYEGFLVETVLEMLEEAGTNNTLIMYPSPDGTKGSYKDSPATGVFAELAAGRADFALMELTLSPGLLDKYTVSMPFYASEMSIITLYPEPDSYNPLAFMEPFSARLWVLIFTSIFIFGVVLWAFEVYGPFTYTSQYRPGEIPHYYNTISNSIANAYIADFFRKYGTPGTKGKSLSFRLVVVPFFFFSFIILSSYSSNLASRLILSPVVIEGSSLKALVYNNLTFSVVNGSDAYGYVKKGTNPITIMAQNLMKIYPTHEEALRAVEKGDVEALLSTAILENYTLRQEPCAAYYMTYTWDELYFVIPYRPNFPFVYPFDILISRDVMNGSKVSFFVDQALNNTAKCPPPVQISTDRVTQLDIPPLAGLWYMMIIFAGASILVLLFERWTYARRNIPSSECFGRPWRDRWMRFLGDRGHYDRIKEAGGLGDHH